MGKPTFDNWNFESGGAGFRSDISGFGFLVIIKKVFYPEYIGVKSKPGELKHLSTRRKGHQPRLRE
jgi:hypothetical protein